jgi:chromosome segregation ATPase
MQDIYKKIEKRIVSLKKKEEVWKGRYREIARQMKELVDSTSAQMKQMEGVIKGLEERTEVAEAKVKKSVERSEEILKLMDKRMTEISELAKATSERAEANDRHVKKLKSDAASQVNEMIARHEKTFAGVLERINLAAKSIEGEFKKEEGLYDRMEGTRKFLESYTPPEPAIMHVPARREERPSPEPALADFRPKSIPSAPAPERGSSFIYAAPMTMPPNSMRQPPRMLRRMHDDFDDLDDDLEMDDMVSENMKGFRNSVDSMDSSISGIAQKLAAIEEKFAKMQQATGPADLERLDDKIRMYTQSVEGIHSRMGTVEKALKDGMTPMMETMKMLTETVKSMKDEARPQAVRKPAPPVHASPAEGVLVPTPSNRAPHTFQRIHAKKMAKPHPGLGVGYG